MEHGAAVDPNLDFWETRWGRLVQCENGVNLRLAGLKAWGLLRVDPERRFLPRLKSGSWRRPNRSIQRAERQRGSVWLSPSIKIIIGRERVLLTLSPHKTQRIGM